MDGGRDGPRLLGEPPLAREQFGFRRTACGCAVCQVPCRHRPGCLDVTDLGRLCPPGEDVFAWAEQHLRALTGRPVPTLVPARQSNGHCHWLFEGRCVVHAAAPYGCAFFDSHQDAAEVGRRWAATVQARRYDAARGGLYYRVWRHLCRKGLIGRPGDEEALAAEVAHLGRAAGRRPPA